VLRYVYFTDTSESTRFLAFTTYVEPRSQHPAEVRAALESGIYDASSAVRAESERRLAELEEYERALAKNPRGVP